jgi:hypothetical protein
MRWENLLVVVDKKTRRIIYRSAWSEWPQMIPATPRLAVRNWKGWSKFTEEKDWNSFNIGWPRAGFGDLELFEDATSEEIETFKLDRTKSAMALRWLNVLYALDRSVSGMIPGIDFADTPAELELMLQERQSVRSMIQNDLKTYWASIWEAQSLKSLEQIAFQIKLESKNVQAFS